MAESGRQTGLPIPEWARDGLALVGAAAIVGTAAYGVSRAIGRPAPGADSASRALGDHSSEAGSDASSTFESALASSAQRAPAGSRSDPAPHVVPGQQSPLSSAREAEGKPRRVRIYVDGCFDMMHYGHSNALRQARALGDELVVGLVSDEEIVANKGSEPVMPFEERLAALTACKFVDEVIANVAYDLTEGWVNTLLEAHDIDFIAHGDDPCITAEGRDAYEYPKRIGRFRMFRRTEGVSTTDLVGRMLLRSREHFIRAGDRRHVRGLRSSSLHDSDPAAAEVVASAASAASPPPPATAVARPSADWKFMPTSRRIAQFAESRTPAAGDRVVYIAGSWDLFNAGHAAALEEARRHGDFVLVGVYDDETVNRLHGRRDSSPIMNLFERALSVLACRYVDDVVMGAPLAVTQDLLRTFKVDVVLVGSVSESRRLAAPGAPDASLAVPRRLGILEAFESPRSLLSSDVVERVLSKRRMFEAKVSRKMVAEEEYRETRQFMEEA